MSDPDHKRIQHVTEHLANERTILAWVRTAIAIMTLGVAINRFSLYLRVIGGTNRMTTAEAEWLGIGLVILAIVVMVGSTVRYLQTAKSIDSESFRPMHRGVIMAATAVVVLGAGSLFWLFSK
ncbi:MAG: YidH family protein [Reyranellales bacterium]